jgi:hypothetical protein
VTPHALDNDQTEDRADHPNPDRRQDQLVVPDPGRGWVGAAQHPPLSQQRVVGRVPGHLFHRPVIILEDLVEGAVQLPFEQPDVRQSAGQLRKEGDQGQEEKGRLRSSRGPPKDGRDPGGGGQHHHREKGDQISGSPVQSPHQTGYRLTPSVYIMANPKIPSTRFRCVRKNPRAPIRAKTRAGE